MRGQGQPKVFGWLSNDGTRPVILKIERIDIPENDKEAAWLSSQDFSNSAGDAYTGKGY